VPEKQLPSADLPYPIAPQRWHFRQSIEYSVTANRAVIDAASRYRETLLFNIYAMGRNAIQRGNQDTWTFSPHRLASVKPNAAVRGILPTRVYDQLKTPESRDPRGYILSADQPDFLTATKFVEALLRTGVAVHRATAAFAVSGRTYPAGSFVVKTAQAFRPHVLDMFEPQDHPDDVPYPGGPPTPPYDSAGWTLAFQMGVKFDRVLDGFDGPFERVTAVSHPTGRVAGVGQPVGYLVSHHQNDAFVAVNRLLKAGESVYWPADRRVGGTAGVGAMYIPRRTGTPTSRRAGSTDRYIRIEETDKLQQRDPGEVLGEFVWRLDSFQFIGATTARQIRIRYWDTGAAPTSGTTGVDGAITFLSKYAASVMAPRKGYDEYAARYKLEAVGGRYEEGLIGGALFRMIQPMVRSRQRVQVAPKPYSVIRRRTWRRAPYIAANQPFGGANMPAVFKLSDGSLTGTVDGSNATFYLAYPLSRVIVHLNGSALIEGDHFTQFANVVTFLYPFIPEAGAEIMIEGWL